MTHISLGKACNRLGKILVAIGVFGAATALWALVDLYIRARYLSVPMLEISSTGFSYDWPLIVNQATFAPLILSGMAFLHDWRAKPVMIALSFCVGIIPVGWWFGIRRMPHYSDFFHDVPPINYGSIFVLLFITLVSFGFLIALSCQKRRLKRKSLLAKK